MSADDKVVVVFTVLGFLGSVTLLLFTSAPPIMCSIFLATGVAALVYRFLGGIQGASFVVGALKLGGTMAALVGLALTINHYLVDQLHSSQRQSVTENDFVGEWHWVYAKGAWEGHVNFYKENGELHFTGLVARVVDLQQDRYQPVFELTNGKARLINGKLDMEADAFDREHNDHLRWVSTAPFPLVPAFRGEFRAANRPELDACCRWGMMAYQWPPRGPY